MSGDRQVVRPAVESGQRDLTCSIHPDSGKFGYPIHHVETRDQWRSWLEAHHDQARGVWLCSWRNSTGRPR